MSVAERVQAAAVDVRIPGENDRVRKDQCVYSFDTPASPGGLFVCMKTFLAFGRDYVQLHYEKTGSQLYLHLKTNRRKLSPEEQEARRAKKAKPTEGSEYGMMFEEDELYETDEVNSLALLPEFAIIDLTAPEIPDVVQTSAALILTAEAFKPTADFVPWEDVRVVSKFAENLQQLDNNVKIPTSGWKCARCEITDNLWMNLTDGTILCGRKQFDGSGGNGHALQHFNETQYPLCVKLGTITPDGADVYSYAEDDMVQDPKLAQHLQHFGINRMALQKTAASMTEMELDSMKHLKFEGDRILERGKELQPAFGPGCTGLYNLGNTCYCNSVVQMLFSTEDFHHRYTDNADAVFRASAVDPSEDAEFQITKLACGLWSGKYAEGAADEVDRGISPKTFKACIGKGHPEFSTNKQQDALEFLQHFSSIIGRESHRLQRPDVTNLFRFRVSERLQCQLTKQVRYTEREESHLFLPVNLEGAQNLEAFQAYQAALAEHEAAQKAAGTKAPFPGQAVLPVLNMAQLFESLFDEEAVPDWLSPAAGTKTTALKSFRLATFPKYLVLAINKFYLSETWTPKKKEVSLVVPPELDMTGYKATGLQPGEVAMSEEAVAAAAAAAPAAAAPQIDEGMVQQLVSMGFSYEGCRKAVFHNPGNVEAAMEWVMTHMGDADFDTPLVVPGAAAAGKVEIREEDISMIEAMGFTRPQARRALQETNGNVERAADWIFNHTDELDTMDVDAANSSAAASGPAAPAKAELPNTSGRYRLKAFVSHIGPSTTSGHYVCHVLKEGRWVLFNDSKVAFSEDVPVDMGYLYLYEAI